MEFATYLQLMADKDASDFFFSVGSPPCIKIHGRTTPVGHGVLQPGEVRKLSDGPDKGACLVWAIPDGRTTYAWCWQIYPLASYL